MVRIIPMWVFSRVLRSILWDPQRMMYSWIISRSLSTRKVNWRRSVGKGEGTGRVRVLSIWLSGRAYDPPEPSEHLHSGPFVRCKIRVLSFLLKTGNQLGRLKPQQHVNMINRLSWQKKNKVYIFIYFLMPHTKFVLVLCNAGNSKAHYCTATCIQ